MITSIRSLLLTALLTATLHAATPPAPPQIFIATKYNPPVGGNRIEVSTSAELRSALAAANLGDIIELRAGNTFTGPFVLPNKTGSGWIYVVSSAYSRLPEPCQRVSPADAVNMPKIVVVANNGGSVQTNAGAHHYRFVGIEFAPVAGNFVYNVVQIGNGEKTAESQPNNIVFDRCYIHGDPNAGSRRGLLMNGAYIAIVDSYVGDCKEDGADSQALAAYSTTGPIKIVNNYLEGAGENVIFGGSDPSIPNAVASDIEIRCNHFFKPLAWMSEQWDIKNLFELKNAQRVLVEGNRFENNWPNAQSGFAVLLTPRNQNNTAPWSVVQDVTIRYNTFVNIAQGINISGFDAPNISQRTSRVLIADNLWRLANIGAGGDGRLFQVLNGPTDITFDHNTGFTINAYVVSDGTPKTDYFVFINNLVTHGTYGFIGTSTGNANTTLARWFNPNWTVTNNADIGGSPANYPAGNYFPANIAAVGFVDYSGGDYRLASTSQYRNLGTDARDLGADIGAIARASTYVCDEPVGAVASEARPHVAPYPNPADMYLHVSSTATSFTVCDLLGRMLISAQPRAGIADVSALPDGMYVMRVEDHGMSSSHVIVVRH